MPPINLKEPVNIVGFIRSILCSFHTFASKSLTIH